MQLYEKYRPRAFDEIAGHIETISVVKRLLKKNDREAFLFFGKSGCGKTTLAMICAKEVCSDPFDIEILNGSDCTVEAVREIEHTWNYCSRGDSGWRAVIVNEAHAMTGKAVQAWLTLLENSGRKRLAVFTTTCIADNMFGEFSSPLFRRLKAFRLEPDLKEFAAYLKKVGDAEGYNGSIDYDRLIVKCEGNLGAALQMMETLAP